MYSKPDKPVSEYLSFDVSGIKYTVNPLTADQCILLLKNEQSSFTTGVTSDYRRFAIIDNLLNRLRKYCNEPAANACLLKEINDEWFEVAGDDDDLTSDGWLRYDDAIDIYSPLYDITESILLVAHAEFVDSDI